MTSVQAVPWYGLSPFPCSRQPALQPSQLGVDQLGRHRPQRDHGRRDRRGPPRGLERTRLLADDPVTLQAVEYYFKTPEDVAQKLQVPFLGMVPKVPGGTTLLSGNVPHTFGEAFRSLRTALAFSNGATSGRVIVVTSSQPLEGKTTTACNLAWPGAASNFWPNVLYDPREGMRQADLLGEMRRIADFLGEPRDMQPQVKEWALAITGAVSKIIPRERALECKRLFVEFQQYFAGEIEKRMRSWTLPFLIRHSAFHTLDHAWEMEDKDLTGEDGA